jgi:hypothetical protein
MPAIVRFQTAADECPVGRAVRTQGRHFAKSGKRLDRIQLQLQQKILEASRPTYYGHQIRIIEFGGVNE